MSDGHYNSVPSAEACQQDCQVHLDGKSSLAPAPARMIQDLFFFWSSLNTHDAQMLIVTVSVILLISHC